MSGNNYMQDWLEKYNNENVALKNLGNNKVELAQLFCRSSIFKAVDDGIEIREIVHHTGSQLYVEVMPISLSQDDLDVLLVLLSECSKRDSYKFTFSMKAMLKSLGKKKGTDSVNKIKMHLRNLSKLVICVDSFNGGDQITGGLVRAKATSDGITVDFYEDLIPLFQTTSHLSLDDRFSLPQGLSRFMYNWIMSSDIPVKLDALKDIASRNHRSDAKHKSDIRSAMNKLKDLGVIIDYDIDIHDRLVWRKSFARNKQHKLCLN